MAVKADASLGDHRSGDFAFSLIEVVLAIGIISFALVGLVALLPIGLQSNRDSMEESQAVNLLQAIIADRQSSPYSTNSSIYSLPAISGTTATTLSGTFFIAESGTTTPSPDGARYRVAYNVYPAAGAQLPVLVNMKVSWPAMQTNQPAAVETSAAFNQQ